VRWEKTKVFSDFLLQCDTFAPRFWTGPEYPAKKPLGKNTKQTPFLMGSTCCRYMQKGRRTSTVHSITYNED